MSEDGPKMKQYQDKIKQLNRAQDDVLRQLDSPIKFGGPLARWKTLMRGALVEASNEENDKVEEFDSEWNDILDKYGIDKVTSMTTVSDNAYQELVDKIQDWQQRLGMGFTETKETFYLDIAISGDQDES